MASLEDELKANTAALNRVADALEKGGGAVAAKTTTTATKTTKDKAPKFTVEQMKAAVLKVKDEKSPEAAKELIEQFAGKDGKLAALANMPDKFGDIIAAAEAALAEEDDSGEDGGL